jgi:GT2 family glycosyltransferase
MRSIPAILVLYRMKLEESPTYQSLRRAEAEDPAIGGSIELLVADNSPEAHVLPSDFRGVYIHDGENPGLARRYNQALEVAIARGAKWLLTLDQDTEITLEYLRELIDLSCTLESEERVAVIVPKLLTDNVMHSPMEPSFGRVGYKLTRESTGVIGAPLRAFNSAALVRVSALEKTGGYPEAYWLDYLDHATFARLQDSGGRIYIMHSVLKHALAEFTVGEGHSPQRRQNIIRAEERFYFEFGTFGERAGRKLDLLRQVIGHFRRGRFAKAADSMKLFLRTRRDIPDLIETSLRVRSAK